MHGGLLDADECRVVRSAATVSMLFPSGMHTSHTSMPCVRPARLLKLASDALASNGISHASLVPLDRALKCRTQPHASSLFRQDELERFTGDPSCTCLLMATGHSGAGGLDLKVASTAFILDPLPHARLEMQAAAHMRRLGSSSAVRVIRVLAADTVEQAMLRLQLHNRQAGAATASRSVGAFSEQVLMSFFRAL